jgi:hypothetical protein
MSSSLSWHALQHAVNGHASCAVTETRRSVLQQMLVKATAVLKC